MITWVFGYFATQSQLNIARNEMKISIQDTRREVERARCISQLSNYITNRQIEQKIALDEQKRYGDKVSGIEHRRETEILSRYMLEQLAEAIANST